jgi:hypothetical protein
LFPLPSLFAIAREEKESEIEFEEGERGEKRRGGERTK